MWKVVVALVVLIAAFGGGWYYGSGQVVVEKGKTEVVVHDKIITKIVERKPDGTIVETTKEEEINHSTNSSTVSQGPSKKAEANYRLGATYWARSPADVLGSGNRINGLGITASRRVVGPLWLDVEVRPVGPDKSAALGISCQF